jgi:hypothetical protein
MAARTTKGWLFKTKMPPVSRREMCLLLTSPFIEPVKTGGYQSAAATRLGKTMPRPNLQNHSPGKFVQIQIAAADDHPDAFTFEEIGTGQNGCE